MTKGEIYQKVKEWLADGEYADGVSILESLKPKHSNLTFFKSVDSSEPGEMHYDILKNRLGIECSDLASHIEKKETVSLIGIKPTETTDKADKADKGSGNLKIVSFDSINEVDLPEYLKPFFARAKELTPLIACLHAELSDESLADEKAQELTSQLIAFDDERSACWEKLDAWAEKRDELILEDETDNDSESDDPVKKGLQIAKRIERLKENITRTKIAIDKNDRPNIKLRNETKLKAYENELAELQLKVQ